MKEMVKGHSQKKKRAFWFRFAAIIANTSLHKATFVFFKFFCIYPWIYTKELYFTTYNSFSLSSGHPSHGKCPKMYLKYESNRVHLDKDQRQCIFNPASTELFWLTMLNIILITVKKKKIGMMYYAYMSILLISSHYIFLLA